jgi:hypothetical protein
VGFVQCLLLWWQRLVPNERVAIKVIITKILIPSISSTGLERDSKPFLTEKGRLKYLKPLEPVTPISNIQDVSDARCGDE